ncbi:hypothetical protein [Variovorax sp. HJSM1_2]|uniref:hypothetical protein n=1 Tax=Variovorax sp. HJSM1_2 TaxID=3366263 RepID=UPI003BD0D7FC
MLRASPLFFRSIVRRLPLFTLLAVLSLSFLTFGYLAYLEFGPFAAVELQVDELYFYSCAARHSITGLWLNPGCHDNKPPLIYLIHQFVQPHSYLYNVWVGKLAAFGVMLLMVGGVAQLALRLAERAAAVASVVLLIAALAPNAQFWALKTESIGLLLVLAAFGLMAVPRPVAHGKCLGAGLLLGLAVLVKQTNVIFLGLSCVWLLWMGRAHWRQTLGRTACVALAGSVPFIGYLAGVSWEGQAESFLASFLVYPSVYAGGVSRGFHAYVMRFANVYELVTTGRELLVALFVLGMLQTLYRRLVCKEPAASLAGRWLVLSAAFCTFAAAMAAPTFWAYHAIPIWVFMSILAGVAFGDLWTDLKRARPPQAVMLGIVLGVSAFTGLLQVWHHNAGRGDPPVGISRPPSIEGASGQYAYVLGPSWPSFYTDNGLIPASNILFSWALPGMPKFELYTPPSPESTKGQRLAQIQAKNLEQLWKDFAGTPPRYLGLVTGVTSAPGSDRLVDVPGFDEYLRAHCRYFKTMTMERADHTPRPLVVYRCNGG